MELGQVFAPYALHAYGWLLRGWMHCTCNLKCGHSPLDGRDYQVLYNSGASLYCPAVMVAADYEQKAIVVAIRGTLSLDDSLTDGTAHCCQFEDSEVSSVFLHAARRRDPASNVAEPREGPSNVGERRERVGNVEAHGVAAAWSAERGALPREGEEEEEVYGHAGIIHAAQRLKWRLHDSGLLPALLSDTAGQGHPQLTPRPREPTAGFRLIIVGHSLGGGASAILALLLSNISSQVPGYASLHALALSPPPVLSPKAAQTCRPFVTSLVLDSDLVPRMSLRSIQLLRARMVQALLLSRQPKWKILLLLGPLRLISSKLAADRFLHSPHSALGRSILERHESMFASGPLEPELHLAGLAMMMDRDGTRKPRVRLMAKSECLAIKVTHTMVWHHMPDVFFTRLLAAARLPLADPADPDDACDISPPEAGPSRHVTRGRPAAGRAWIRGGPVGRSGGGPDLARPLLADPMQ
ncbi:Alpha/Beta hydrolase protein [Baffinella frigidus]|nr:Alpha/Beta hydrolase protein [Cryptophyta sp. CCMP2293]